MKKLGPLWIGEKLGPLKTSGPQAVNSAPFLTRLQEKSSASISKKERAELIKWRLEFGKGVRQQPIYQKPQGGAFPSFMYSNYNTNVQYT